MQSPLRVTQRLRGGSHIHAQVAAEIVIDEAEPSRANFLHTFHNDCVGAVRHTHQTFSNHIQEKAEKLRNNITRSQASSWSFLAANCFPPQLMTKKEKKSLAGSHEAQDLVSVGSRELLKIKLYDFAVYLDRKQAKQSKLSKSFAKKAGANMQQGGSELPLTCGIRDSRDIEMSLVVRAARNLPIRLMTKEYERILKRRIRLFGGSPEDPALLNMLEHFREEKLPEDIKHRGSVKKGTVLAFSRDRDGNICARAQNHDLVHVKSQQLAQAIFDIYLGKQVVSNKARRDVGFSFIKLLDDGDFAAPEDNLICRGNACKNKESLELFLSSSEPM